MATSFACTTAMMLTCISLITCMHCGHGKCMYYDHGGASKYCCQIKLTYDGRNTLVYDGHNTWPRYILIMAEACAGTVAMCMDVLWRTYMYYYVTQLMFRCRSSNGREVSKRRRDLVLPRRVFRRASPSRSSYCNRVKGNAIPQACE